MSVALHLRTKFIAELGTAPLSILDEIIDWVDVNLDPEEVYTTKRLEQWAYENGFKKFE